MPMIYTYICPCCSELREEVQGINEPHVLKCMCGMDMDRHWKSSLPNIAGDTVAAGCDQRGYDETLGEYIHSRGQRRELMKKKGLEPYTPEPEQKAFRKELLYNTKHGKNDPSLGQTQVAIQRESGRARMKQAIREVKKKHKD
jgi:hypothetical protein